MTGKQCGLIRKGQNPLTDASDQLHAIPAGILIVPTAALENSVSNEGRIMVLIIKDDRIRSMTGRVDYPK